MVERIVAALVLLVATAAADELATARRLLRSSNPDARLRGVEICIRVDSRRSVEMVEQAIERANRDMERDSRKLDELLFHLTGITFYQDPKHWRHWWEKNGEAVRANTWTPGSPTEMPEGHTVASFFRIPLQSERILFVLDFSGSMAEPLDLKDKQIRKLLDEHGLPQTRLGYAQAEFIRAINSLPDGAYFDVLGYNDDVKRIKHRMMKVDRFSRKRAIRWVLRLETAELTNIWAALHESFRDYLASSGQRRFEELPDTIVFLTDGIATRGRFTETEDLRTLVQIWNQPVDAIIHCVGIGKGHDRELLKGMAEDTGGYYVDVTAGLKELERRRRPPPAGLVTAGERREQKSAELESALELLDSGDDEERAKGVRMLGAMRGAGTWDPLVEALRDPSANVQEAAIETFAKIGAPAVPHLIRALRIDDDDCIANAAFAIARIGPAAKEALPHLEKRRNRDDSRARNAVLKAIAALG